MKDIFKQTISYILKIESRLVLWKYKPKVIAITGSVGKTSTKDALYTVLSKFTYVRKSEKSYNSEIGLPLTILGVPNGWNNPYIWLKNIFKGLWLIIYPHKYPKWLVLEVGVGKPGDMKKTAMWLKTDVVVITAIGTTPAHIEFFSSRKNLIEEKSKLLKTLKKDGLLVLNADDEDVLSLKNKTKNITVTYGFNNADFLASGESIAYSDQEMPIGVVFRVDVNGMSLPVFIEGALGRNHIYASLASLAVAYGLKWNVIEAIEALKKYDMPQGRMRLLSGINDSFIIDDTYNSSPFACESALKTLSMIKPGGRGKYIGRRVVVLGDMLELGKHTVEAHCDIGKLASEIADVIIVVGPRAKDIKVTALENGFLSSEKSNREVFEFSNSNEAGEFLKNFVRKHDIVLVKGSQGVRMERAVEHILQNQEEKNNLLVRQDREWLNKV